MLVDVLVVDDNRDLAAALAIWLRTHGKRVDTACTGHEGLAKIAALHPAVALIDLALPEMSGWQVARRARAMALPRLPKLVAMTGMDDPVLRTRSLAAGFQHHLIKPIDDHALLDLLEL